MRISDWSSDVCSSDLNWSALSPQEPSPTLLAETEKAGRDAANSGLRREPELPDHVAIARETSEPKRQEEFAIMDDNEPEDAARQNRIPRQQTRGTARQVALDPNDDHKIRRPHMRTRMYVSFPYLQSHPEGTEVYKQ